MRRFYTERTNLRPGSSVKLPQSEATHIRHSLRLSAEQQVILFNGEKSFVAELGLVKRDVVMANILYELEDKGADQLDIELTLGMSLIRAQNFELVLQKATELGVGSIQPIITEFGQPDSKTFYRKRDRWEKIILEACKQSERADIPELYSPVDTKKINHEQILVFTLSRQIKKLNNINLIDIKSWAERYRARKLMLLIGPEGGFSPAEHKHFAQQNYQFTEILNGKILRAETAAISAIALVTHLFLSQH